MSDTLSPAPRSRTWLWIALAGAALAAGGGGAAWWYLRPKPPAPPQPPAFPVQEGADPAVVAAVEAARQKVLDAPASGPAWGDLGMTFAAHGYEPEADVCFAEAERLAPADPRWPYFRAVFAGVHQPERAAEHLRRALAAATAPGAATPPDALAVIRLRLAEALFDRQALDEAEALFREELAKAPDDPRARFGLAQIALTRGDRRAAREAFTALADNPYARQRAAGQAAALARADGDLPAARKYEEIARQAGDDPSWPDPYLRDLRKREVGQQALLVEVDSLQAAGQLPQAMQLILEVVRINPQPRVLATAGLVAAKLHDYPRAEALLRECLQKEPTHAQANCFLAVVLFEQAALIEARKPEATRALRREAVAAARAAVATKPDHGLAWLYLGRSLLELKETAAAVEALRQAVACRPEYVDTHLYLAEALAAAGERDEAVRAARNAEKLAPPGETRPRQLLDRLQPPVTPKK